MKGVIELPGDKSISHRVAMLAALAEGPCHIFNFNTGHDCAATLDCLQQLGCEVRLHDQQEKFSITIVPKPLIPPGSPLDCRNSGSTMRMLTGLLAGQDIPATLIGDVSLIRRPMQRLAEPLRIMGAVLTLRDDNYAPITLFEGVKRSIRYQMPIASAQVKSAVLLAGLRFPGTAVIEAMPTRDHTERLLEFLLPARASSPSAETAIPVFEYSVPGDPSSAAFFVVGALMNRDSDITLRNVLMNPHRVAYLRKLKSAGARIDVMHQRLLRNEVVGDVRVRSTSEMRPIRVSAEEVPSMIDELPVLSLAGARFGFEVEGASELRHKESDRIEAMLSNLDAMEITVEEFADGYKIYPGILQPGIAKTFDDHRIAMTFAVAGMEIDNPDCINVSFPEFFDLLARLQS